MRPFRKIDLHMHSTVSDGTDTPEALLAHVRAAGIELFSVTDHDAILCGTDIPKLLKAGDPCFVSGVEFSCRDEEGKYHILGYGCDPEADAIRRTVEYGHALRMRKVTARLDFLRTEFGFDFPQKEIAKLLAQDNPGKPHIGNLMVQYGYAASKESAIRDYIDQAKIKSEYLRPEDAIRSILESGGVPVLAHPFYGSGDQLILGEEMDARIRRLMGFGLRGLEAFYSGFTEKLRNQALSLAERYGLYITAGSDYHGKNKLVALGDTGLDGADDCPDGLRRFLQAVKIYEGAAD